MNTRLIKQIVQCTNDSSRYSGSERQVCDIIVQDDFWSDIELDLWNKIGRVKDFEGQRLISGEVMQIDAVYNTITLNILEIVSLISGTKHNT